MAFDPQVVWDVSTKARAVKLAKFKYGDKAYIDDIDVCLGATTVARFYMVDGLGLMLVDARGFKDME